MRDARDSTRGSGVTQTGTEEQTGRGGLLLDPLSPSFLITPYEASSAAQNWKTGALMNYSG